MFVGNFIQPLLQVTFNNILHFSFSYLLECIYTGIITLSQTAVS